MVGGGLPLVLGLAIMGVLLKKDAALMGAAVVLMVVLLLRPLLLVAVSVLVVGGGPPKNADAVPFGGSIMVELTPSSSYFSYSSFEMGSRTKCRSFENW